MLLPLELDAREVADVLEQTNVRGRLEAILVEARLGVPMRARIQNAAVHYLPKQDEPSGSAAVYVGAYDVALTFPGPREPRETSDHVGPELVIHANDRLPYVEARCHCYAARPPTTRRFGLPFLDLAGRLRFRTGRALALATR